jgi:hypothetical protein
MLVHFFVLSGLIQTQTELKIHFKMGLESSKNEKGIIFLHPLSLFRLA